MTLAQEIAGLRRSCDLRLELREKMLAKHPDAGPATVLVSVELLLRLCARAEEDFCRHCGHCSDTGNRGAGGAADGGGER